MKATFQQFASFNGCIRLLLINQLGINLGFYMLMPYLANHLSSGLGMAAWTVGLVLGVRTLSQQGMFLVGGTLADRLGCKPMIIAGCALRFVGFAMLGLVDDLPGLLIASIATGLAGAFFNPAVRAYVADQAGERRVEAFAIFNVFYQAGIFVGPLVGLLLLSMDFRAVCLVAATVFAVLTIVQSLWLPAAPPDPGPESGKRAGTFGSVAADWRQVVGNRSFMLFSVAMIGSYVLSSQIYLALPLQAAHVLGDEAGQAGSTALFAISAIVAVIGQVRLTAWAKNRWSSHRAIVLGLAMMSAAFLPLILTAHLRPAGPVGIGDGLAWMLPTLVSTILLTGGTILTYPFEMDTIVTLARDRLVATHYGLYNTLSGIGITLGNLGTGAVWDLGEAWNLPALPWIALAATGAACTTALAALAPTLAPHGEADRAVHPPASTPAVKEQQPR
ncbi:MFS transporter [Actinomadura soli]|uniref:MFS transporter n=1 Tax=Actinomadura soli TaxID=2508997 RepID=A0A5C4JH91_9ACTN|nr:MFS transporter [Actinomadura soli]TMR05683.1 MFS transporter [Actinomadura soli]